MEFFRLDEFYHTLPARSLSSTRLILIEADDPEQLMGTIWKTSIDYQVVLPSPSFEPIRDSDRRRHFSPKFHYAEAVGFDITDF